MGLDQHAYHCNARLLGPVMTDFEEDFPDADRFHYWRKHPNLQGWMQELYIAKGGVSPDFNCVPVRLLAEDLDRLEAAVRNDLLPLTRGFFFGTSDGSEVAGDLEFIAKARAFLTQGEAVYYTSSW